VKFPVDIIFRWDWPVSQKEDDMTTRPSRASLHAEAHQTAGPEIVRESAQTGTRPYLIKSSRKGVLQTPSVPYGFILFSDAISRLANGMWGGLQRPVPVQVIKRTFPRERIGFSRWREQAGQCLGQAAAEGNLAVYLAIRSPLALRIPALTRRHLTETEPMLVPVEVVRRLMTSHGSLPDHPLRPSMKIAGGDQKLLALLTIGVLVVRESEFNDWYRSEHAKGKWASQRSRSKRRGGRPTKQTEAMRSAIWGLVRGGAWSGKASITELHRLLINSGQANVPSSDTLARLVEQLHHETGEPGLLRRRRSPRRHIWTCPGFVEVESLGSDLPERLDPGSK
jgi:hypothetical protein